MAMWSRRQFLTRATLGAAGASLAPLWSRLAASEATHGAPMPFRVYIGTYTNTASRGIYCAAFDAATGALSAPALAAELTNPSFLAIHPNRRFVYAVSEVSEFQGRRTGAVCALAMDQTTGTLTLLGQQESGGSAPCYVVVDKAGKNALVANYGGGSCASLPIRPDGSLGAATTVRQHSGSSVNKSRQAGPHAHSIILDEANRFAFCADLGLDQVLVYRFDAGTGSLTPNVPPAATVDPGSGPRHCTFHPSGAYAYVINELTSTITVFRYQSSAGLLEPIQTISTLPSEFQGTSWAAEVVVHPSGRFVYGSNRGHNSIAVFSVDLATGRLTLVAHQEAGIKTPRNFAIDPTGRYALVANQDGDSIIVFAIERATGRIVPTDAAIAVPRPVCVRFVPMA